jgi:hypothetical protein
MEENKGGVEGRGWGGRFNEPCLGFFLSGREKDLRVLGGVNTPPNPLFLIPPNWGHLEGEWLHLYLNNVNCQLCPYYVNLYLFL